MNILDQQQELFNHLKNNDIDAFIDIIELERPLLYDYVFRMTGIQEYSSQVIDEVTRALFPQAESFETLQDLRVNIYSTAKNFAADMWNADISKLQNLGYKNIDKILDKSPENAMDIDFLKIVEEHLNTLFGWEKEPLLLYYRFDFLRPEIAEIMSINERIVNSNIESALSKLNNKIEADIDNIKKAISNLPKHPISKRSMHSTVALSQIMKDLNKTKEITHKWKRSFVISILLVVIIIIAAFFLVPYIRSKIQ